MMFHLCVVITVKDPRDIERVVRALARMAPMCRVETGCVRWEAYHSAEMTARIVLLETWRSRADWEAHLEGAAFVEMYRTEVLPCIEREVHSARLL